MNFTEDQETGEFVAFDQQVSKFYETEPKTRVKVEVAGKSHPGKARPNNEDQYLAVRRYRGRQILTSSVPEEILEPTEDHAYTFAVADGLGGQNFGELASFLALRTGWELGGDEIKWTVKINEHESEELRRKAEVFFRLIDQSLHAEVRENPKLTGMATTLTLCYSIGPKLFVMHVGDSRAYLYSGGTLHRLTHDHNLGQLMVDSGVASPGSAKFKKYQHVLTNVLGGTEKSVEVDVDEHLLADGDRLLLCTDGLFSEISDDEIARTLEQYPEPSDACQALIDLTLTSPARDNVTVVLARYRFL